MAARLQATNAHVLVPGMLALTLIASCEKAHVDEEVRRLCAADGGIKMYETVKLPSDRFNPDGVVKFYRPANSELALGADYVFDYKREDLRKGSPQMWRIHIRVSRRADRKLLGEAVSYARRGGDLPGPWHPSSFVCPENAGDTFLLRAIFVKAD